MGVKEEGNGPRRSSSSNKLVDEGNKIVGNLQGSIAKLQESIAKDQRKLGSLLQGFNQPFKGFDPASRGKELIKAPGLTSASLIAEFASRHSLGTEAVGELQLLVDKAKQEQEDEDLDDQEIHRGHGAAMPFMSMPTVLQRYGEQEPVVHIGWADIYLDLILVGVAFNGGLLLKHAFYLCEPPGDSWRHRYHGGGHGHLDADAASVSGHEHRLLFGEPGAHPPCVGLGIGLMHVLAFGLPVLGAWLKETMFRARCESLPPSNRALLSLSLGPHPPPRLARRLQIATVSCFSCSCSCCLTVLLRAGPQSKRKTSSRAGWRCFATFS